MFRDLTNKNYINKLHFLNYRLRDEIARVLFCHYEVLSILTAPSHLMLLFGLGVKDGLVLDVGDSEATLIPVYESVPILKVGF
jgi:actin-related protein 10